MGLRLSCLGAVRSVESPPRSRRRRAYGRMLCRSPSSTAASAANADAWVGDGRECFLMVRERRLRAAGDGAAVRRWSQAGAQSDRDPPSTLGNMRGCSLSAACGRPQVAKYLCVGRE